MKRWKRMLAVLLLVYLTGICINALAEEGMDNPAEHTCSFVFREQAPTCTAYGERTRYCQECQAVESTEKIDPIPHAYEIIEDSESTCTTAGKTIRKCGMCGDTKETEKALAGHEMTVEMPAVAAACEKAGNSAYRQCAHCTYTEGKESIAALGHDRKLLSDRTAAPTCTVKGSETWQCTRCGDEETVSVDTVDHVHFESNWVVVEEATCTRPGTIENACIHCGGDQYYRQLNPLGHDMSGVSSAITGNSCTQNREGYVVCANGCGYTETIVLKATEHRWTQEPQEIIEPACTQDGKKIWKCQNTACAQRKEIILPALGHDLDTYVFIAATCTLEGKKDIRCLRAGCSYEALNTVIPPVGHKGKWEVTTPATAEADGEAQKRCIECGEVMERKAVPYSAMRYSNSLCAFGPTTHELIGNNEWYRLTPVDLSVEGIFSYPLIASNQYVVGTVTVTIANDAVTVTYHTAAQIKVISEKLRIYADMAALKAGNAEEYAFGVPIDIGEDTRVILSILLIADYNAVGAGVTGFMVDEARIEEMKALID